MLEGKNAIITGATRGIGREIAILLAKRGANIALNYREENDSLNELRDIIKGYGRKVITVQCDVAKSSEVNEFIKIAHKQLGAIDILVNSAGITKDNLILRMSEEAFNEVMDVNLKGTFNTTKAVSNIMVKQRRGKIINISSVVGLTGNIGQSNYAASKAGVIGFSKSVAKELATRGINVNVVAPGFIRTDMTKALNERVKETILNNIPMKRMGEAKEVAELIAFLSSDMADYITGQVINVDGGMVMY